MRILSCFVSRLSPACYQQQLSASYLVISNSLESYLLKKKIIEFIFKIIYFKFMTLTFLGVWSSKLKHQYSWHVHVLWIKPSLSNLGFVKLSTFFKWMCHWHSIQCTHEVYNFKVIFLTSSCVSITTNFRTSPSPQRDKKNTC